jgi:hypothetical protein
VLVGRLSIEAEELDFCEATLAVRMPELFGDALGSTPAMPLQRVQGQPMLLPLLSIRCIKWGKKRFGESNAFLPG